MVIENTSISRLNKKPFVAFNSERRVVGSFQAYLQQLQ